FFSELRRSGQPDRAVAVARRAMGTRPETWAPVLYLAEGVDRLWIPDPATASDPLADLERAAAQLSEAIAAVTPPPPAPEPPAPEPPEPAPPAPRPATRPGFADLIQERRTWDGLLTAIRRRTCTPIVGPGLLTPLVGSFEALAARWAEQYGYPYALRDQDE